MKNLKQILVVLFLLAPAAAFSQEAQSASENIPLREGDIIFIQSMSAQAPAIAEAMGSSWTHVGVAIMKDASWLVAETAATSSLTPLSKFLDKSRDRQYTVKRFKKWSEKPDKKGLARLKKWLFAHLGRKYDIYFEWSDDAYYCSEYVWKAFHNALPGHPALSTPQKFMDLKQGGPLAERLLKKRYGSAEKRLDLDEPIVTPVALLNSDQLETVAP
jgi:hypothetical protein